MLYPGNLRTFTEALGAPSPQSIKADQWHRTPWAPGRRSVLPFGFLGAHKVDRRGANERSDLITTLNVHHHLPDEMRELLACRFPKFAPHRRVLERHGPPTLPTRRQMSNAFHNPLSVHLVRESVQPPAHTLGRFVVFGCRIQIRFSSAQKKSTTASAICDYDY